MLSQRLNELAVVLVYFEDTKRYVDALDLTREQRHAIFEGNARRVFPQLDAKLKERGL